MFAPQHERTVKLLHYELQEITPFNVKLHAICSVKHATVSFLREQSCRWRSLTFISHSALQLSFFPPLWYFTLSGFWQPGRWEYFKWACSVQTRAEGHFEVHFDNAFSVPSKTLSIFSCLYCLWEFRSATSVIFFLFLGGGADRFYRTCLTRDKHLPRWKFPKRHAWPWSFSVTLNLTNRSAENTHNTFAVFRHRDPLWLVQSAGVSEPCCIAVGRGVHRELLLQKG